MLPGARTRGEINVLLVGDPGVSKSQLLRCGSCGGWDSMGGGQPPPARQQRGSSPQQSCSHNPLPATLQPSSHTSLSTCSYVHKLAPRGIYTSGKGSSAVGLTAYVTKVGRLVCQATSPLPRRCLKTAFGLHVLPRKACTSC